MNDEPSCLNCGYLFKNPVKVRFCQTTVECRRLRAKAYWVMNPDKKLDAGRRSYSNLSPEKKLVNWARQRARAANAPCTISHEDVIIPDVCPVLGMPLSRGDGKATAQSPTLDRIIPSLGYVPGNVEVISMQANCMKRDATPEELLRFCRYYSNLFGR